MSQRIFLINTKWIRPNCDQPTWYQYKNSWMQDPRYKYEYLDSGQIWVTVTGDDESDKHL